LGKGEAMRSGISGSLVSTHPPTHARGHAASMGQRVATSPGKSTEKKVQLTSAHRKKRKFLPGNRQRQLQLPQQTSCQLTHQRPQMNLAEQIWTEVQQEKSVTE